MLMTMRVGISSVCNLHFAPPTTTDGRVTVAPPLDVFEDGCELWKSTLVGHFVGQKLLYPVVNSIAKRIWSSYGLSEVCLRITVSSSSILILLIMPLMCWNEPHGTWPTGLWCLNVGSLTCNFWKMIWPEFRYGFGCIMSLSSIGLLRGWAV